MEDYPHVATTVRRFTDKRCSGLRLEPKKVLRVGMTVKIVRETSGMGDDRFHDSTQTITSIQVNHEPRQEVRREDGICAIKINGVVPPNGSNVLLIHDGQKHDSSASYMAKSGL